MRGPISAEITASCAAIFVRVAASIREGGLPAACRTTKPKGRRLPTATSAAEVRSSSSAGRVLVRPISSETRGLAQGRGPLAISAPGEAPCAS